jgi:predicted site-specific integrase-resolvase
MDAKSYRPAQIAERNNVSRAFIYEEIRAGRLRARKAQAATIITTEDEQAWLDAMPIVGVPNKSEVTA